MKAYCQTCIHWKPPIIYGGGMPDDEEECRASKNMKETYWNDEKKPKGRPEKINKNNDCKWYKKGEKKYCITSYREYRKNPEKYKIKHGWYE
jgi:hypothetical protein